MTGRKTFSNAVKKAVFTNADPIEGQNPSVWRRDSNDRVICFPSYGDSNSSYGWNIHHTDGNKENNQWSNLQAIHFESHKDKHEGNG